MLYGEKKYKMKLLQKGRGVGGFTLYHHLPSTSSGRNSSSVAIIRNKSELKDSSPNVDLMGTVDIDAEEGEDLIGAGCGWGLTSQKHFLKKNKKKEGDSEGSNQREGKKPKKGNKPKVKPKKPKKEGKGVKGKGKQAKKPRYLKDIFNQYKI